MPPKYSCAYGCAAYFECWIMGKEVKHHRMPRPGASPSEVNVVQVTFDALQTISVTLGAVILISVANYPIIPIFFPLAYVFIQVCIFSNTHAFRMQLTCHFKRMLSLEAWFPSACPR